MGARDPSTVVKEDGHVLGIDAARWQGVLNWEKVLNAKPVFKDGSLPPRLNKNDIVRFAYIKATHGVGGLDPMFHANADRSSVMPFRGFYMWFVPTQDPIEQADKFVDAIDTYQRDRDLPPSIDVEDNVGGRVVGRQILDPLRICATHVEQRLGRTVALYTGKWFWQLPSAIGDLDDSWCASKPLWHSEYPGRIPGDDEHSHLPKPWSIRSIDEAFWQFDGDKGLYLPAECGSTGIPIDSDFNRFLGNEDSLSRFIVDTIIDSSGIEIVKIDVPSLQEVLDSLVDKDKS